MYPWKGIIQPWLLHQYKWNQTWNNPLPNIIIIVGSFRCRDFGININRVICNDLPLAQRDPKSPNQYSATYWNDSFTFIVMYLVLFSMFFH